MSLKDGLNMIVEWIITEGIKLVIALIVLYIVFKIINFLSKRIEKKIKKRKKQIDETITRVSLSAFRKGLKFISFVCFLGYIGIETTSIAAAITSAGLGIGLALQGSLANFAGGVIVLIMRPYKIGDYIESDGKEGTVEDIKLFYTYIVTIDNKVIVIPNGKMASSSITNYSSKNLRRLDMYFIINYSNDFFKVKKIILKSVMNSSLHINVPSPFVGVDDYDNDSFKIVLKVWCLNDKYWDLYYSLKEDIIKQFQINKIKTLYDKVEVILNK